MCPMHSATRRNRHIALHPTLSLTPRQPTLNQMISDPATHQPQTEILSLQALALPAAADGSNLFVHIDVEVNHPPVSRASSRAALKNLHGKLLGH